MAANTEDAAATSKTCEKDSEKTLFSVNTLALNQHTVKYSCSCEPSETENREINSRHSLNYIAGIARFS